MVKLYFIEPEVAGGWGSATVVTNRKQIEAGDARIPEIAYCEYVFDGWLGDEILESFPCFIVTDKLRAYIEDARLTGFHFQSVKISKSDIFQELQGHIELPLFWRLMPEGRVCFNSQYEVESWSGHDICVAQRGELVVTELALSVLRQSKFENCEIHGLRFKS